MSTVRWEFLNVTTLLRQQKWSNTKLYGSQGFMASGSCNKSPAGGTELCTGEDL